MFHRPGHSLAAGRGREPLLAPSRWRSAPVALALRHLRRIVLTVLLGGLLGATLVRLGPGFGVDERDLDQRLSAESRAAIRSEHAADSNIAVFYLRYLAGLVHGDLGFSRSLEPAGVGTIERAASSDAGVAGLRRIGRAGDRFRAGAFHRVVARAGLRPGNRHAERRVSGGARRSDRAGIPVDERARTLGHRPGGLPARVPVRQESAGVHLSAAARPGGTGQGVVERQSAVRSRGASHGPTTGGAGGDFGQPGLRRFHSDRGDLGHAWNRTTGCGARRSIATCRCW